MGQFRHQIILVQAFSNNFQAYHYHYHYYCVPGNNTSSSLEKVTFSKA